MNNQLKKPLLLQSCVKVPIWGNCRHWHCRPNTPKKWTLQCSSERHVFLHFLRVLSFISWTCSSVWFEWVPGRGASEDAAPHLSRDEAVWTQGPAVSCCCSLWPQEDGTNVTFLKCLDVNLQGRKVPPCPSEGIGLDTCPPKPRLWRAGPGCFEGDNVLQLFSACKSQATAFGAGIDRGFWGQKPARISVRKVFLTVTLWLWTYELIQDWRCWSSFSFGRYLPFTDPCALLTFDMKARGNFGSTAMTPPWQQVCWGSVPSLAPHWDLLTETLLGKALLPRKPQGNL